MILNCLYRNLPPGDRVALLAPGAELPAVDVRVTVGALGSHVGEDGLGVTVGAGHTRVQSTQGEPSAIVIEFWHCTDRLPSQRGMAVLTWNV